MNYKYILNGPWNYFETVFPENNKIYFAKDILFEGRRGKYQLLVERLMKSLLRIEESFGEKKFSRFDRQWSEWNMFAIPFTDSESNKARVELFKKYAKTEKVDLANFHTYGIKKCLFISLFLLNAKRKNKSTSQAGSKLSHKEALQKFSTNHFNEQQEEANSTTKRISMQKSLFKELNTEEAEENQKKKINQEIESVALPIEEYLEFLKDFKEVVSNSKSNLFTAMSEFNLIRKLADMEKLSWKSQ